jgi:hypothetical protein
MPRTDPIKKVNKGGYRPTWPAMTMSDAINSIKNINENGALARSFYVAPGYILDLNSIENPTCEAGRFYGGKIFFNFIPSNQMNTSYPSNINPVSTGFYTQGGKSRKSRKPTKTTRSKKSRNTRKSRKSRKH